MMVGNPLWLVADEEYGLAGGDDTPGVPRAPEKVEVGVAGQPSYLGDRRCVGLGPGGDAVERNTPCAELRRRTSGCAYS